MRLGILIHQENVLALSGTHMLLAGPKDHGTAERAAKKAEKLAEKPREWDAAAGQVQHWLDHFDKLKANPQDYYRETVAFGKPLGHHARTIR